MHQANSRYQNLALEYIGDRLRIRIHLLSYIKLSKRNRNLLKSHWKVKRRTQGRPVGLRVLHDA